MPHIATSTLAVLIGCGATLFGGEAPEPIAPINAGSVRVERVTVPGGGELFTFFNPVSDSAGRATSQTPMVSILRDTLGDDDPANDQVRDVWAFTYARGSWFRHFAAAIPFFYHRAGSKAAAGMPPSLVDMANPSKGTFPRASARILQSAVFDPLGAPFRATTRAYQSRVSEYRNMNLWRAFDTLNAPSVGQDLDRDELERVRGRVLLSRNTLGGLVDDRYAVRAVERFETSAAETRGRNWELLRQRAEDNGLYFEPLSLARTGQTFALLWMDQAQAGNREARFDSKFLGISDPFRDSRIARWNDYSETWRLDEHGSKVNHSTAGAGREARMIPLALYALEHPKSPLMLVDFRDPGKPRRKEMMRRATDDVATGVLGWTGFGNWTWLAVRSSYSFIKARHGSPLDRGSRVRAFVQVRQALIADHQLNPQLRLSLSNKLDKLGMNPFDSASTSEAAAARAQYEALLARVRTGAIAEHLKKQRLREADEMIHSAKQRALRRLGTVASFGIYRHKDLETPTLMAAVNRERKIAYHRRVLEGAISSAVPPEFSPQVEQIRRSVIALGELVTPAHRSLAFTASLLSWVLTSTSDSGTREACLASLAQLSGGGRPESPKPDLATSPDAAKSVSSVGSQ